MTSTPPQPPRIQLWIIPVGAFDADVAALTPHDRSGRRTAAPVYAYLVDTGQGWLLFDTGCSRTLMADPASVLGSGVAALTPVMDPERDYITQQLAALGVDPSGIALLATSHLHFDHAGANADPAWARAEFLVQRAEWEAVRQQPRHYPDAGLNPPAGARLRLLDGDTPIAPGVTLISTPGHTPGHQSLMVEFPSGGGVFITSDAVYTRAHYDPAHVGAAVDPVQSAASVARIQALCQEHGLAPFFSHDPHQAAAEGWQLAPHAYSQHPFPIPG